MQGIIKRFVYILRSESGPARHYVGLTSDVGERLHWHNEGPSGQTIRDLRGAFWSPSSFLTKKRPFASSGT